MKQKRPVRNERPHAAPTFSKQVPQRMPGIEDEDCRCQFARPEERTAAGARINPATAQVFFEYAHVMDPYGEDPDLPEELQCVGRVYFAVDPGERLAVALYDLPETTVEALREKVRVADAEGWNLIFGALSVAGSDRNLQIDSGD